MTISTTRNSRAGFTLLEIMLVVGLGVIFAALAIPSIGSWLVESRLNSEAGGLIEAVQNARLQAEDRGEIQVVALLGPKDRPGADKRKNVSYFSMDRSMQWKVSRPGPDGKPMAVSEIRVDSHGMVDPVTFRVSEGEKYVEYQFDFLTGHAIEQSASF